MATDRHELILTRLLTIATGIPGIVKAFRNRTEISEEQRPAIVIMDADEEASEAVLGGRQIATPAPFLVVLSPEIYLMLGATVAAGANVGTALSAFRLLILNAVLTDGSLLGICGSNGSIKFKACATALGRDRSMEGEMALAFAFTYVLNPSELV